MEGRDKEKMETEQKKCKQSKMSFFSLPDNFLFVSTTEDFTLGIAHAVGGGKYVRIRRHSIYLLGHHDIQLLEPPRSVSTPDC